MSDPRDVERAIERLGRRLVTGGEELPEEVSVPAADLAALLAEVARLREWLQAMQTLSAVSDVVRGDPQASLKSGAALALLHEMTRDGEPAYEEDADGVLRAESKPWWIEAERDAALAEVARLRAEAGDLRRELAAVPELAMAYSCACEERDAARARVARLRRVALAAHPRSISILDNMCHGLGCGHCLTCGFMGLRPGDLADGTNEAPGRREGEPGAEEG